MKCLSRSTLGVVIGVLNVLAYILVAVYSIINLITVNTLETDPNISKADAAAVNAAITYSNIVFSIVLVVCVVLAILSILLIIGIVKKRHSLMLPWLVVAVISFVGSCIRFVFTFFGAIAASVNLGVVLVTLLVGVLLMALNGFIIYKIYTLYKDIRDSNKESSNNNHQISTTNVYPPQPQYFNMVTEKS